MKTTLPPYAKRICLLALFAAFLNAANAQMSDGRTRFGLKAGVSIANFTKDDLISDRDGRVGFVGGAFSKIPLGKKGRLALRPELLFAMKGATVTAGSAEDLDFKLNYLELPLSLEFNLMAIFNIHAGAQAGVLLSEADKVDFETNKLDAGWHLGTGIDLGNIGLHIRYNAGFAQLFDTVLDNEIHNWNLTITAAYSFN